MRSRSAALAAVLLFVAVGAARGQVPRTSDPLSIAVRGGFSSPKGDLGDLADDGYVLGLALGYRLTQRVTLLVEGSLEDLKRGGRLRPAPVLGGVQGPNIELWRVMALGALELTDPDASRWEVDVQAGGGATVVSADAFANGSAFETVEPTVMLGLMTGYDLGRDVTAFVRGGGSIWLDDSTSGRNYFGKEVTLTHTLGLRVHF